MIASAEHLDTVRARIAATARAAGRDAAEVTLVAVSKTFPADRILPVLDAGHRVFGENRVQEAAAKWPDLRASYPDVRLHLIGPLQTNKAAEAIRLFDVIETVDRPKLARILAAEMADQGRRPDLLVQVNTGEEAQKSGVLPGDAPDLIDYCRDELGLALKGLMCIPPLDEEPALHFALLADLAARHRRDGDLGWLSMGMSADFETAIQFGATHVRLGTAVFGPRAPRT